MAKIIFGCGYLGQRVARLWQADDEEVYVVTRSTQRAEQFATTGLVPLVGDIATPGELPELPKIKTALFAVGFDRTKSRSIHDVYVEGLRNALAALPETTRRMVYISSTGVFGNHDGGWVTEDSPCRPARAGGEASLEAEALLAMHEFGNRSVVLRMAGLYGPGRIPRSAEMVQGAPIVAPTEGYLNLIHVDDAARVVVAAAEHASPAALYLVSDGHPVERWEYYHELARLLNAPQPRFAEPKADAPAARRAAEDKRVSNQRMIEQLGIELQYPSYREGLASIVANR